MRLAKRDCGVGAVTSHGDFASLPDEGVHFISGHFGYSYAKSRLENRYSFTFLRNPIDRVISLYNFCSQRNPEQFPIYAEANKRNFEDFVSFCSTRPTSSAGNDAKIVYETVWNNMTWQLAYGWNASLNEPNRTTVLEFSEDDLLNTAKSNLDHFDFVGLDTTYSKDAAHVVSHLGIKATEIPVINSSVKRIHRERLSNETIDLVRKSNLLDLELYDYACSNRH